MKTTGMRMVQKSIHFLQFGAAKGAAPLSYIKIGLPPQRQPHVKLRQ
jgi:hypothetical protein